MIRSRLVAKEKVQGVAYAMGGLTLLIGGYDGATSKPAWPIWLTVATAITGLANLVAARRAGSMSYKVEVAFEAMTALLIFGSAYVTFERGLRHLPLALAWTLAGCLYATIAVLHWIRKEKVSFRRRSDEAAPPVGEATSLEKEPVLPSTAS